MIVYGITKEEGSRFGLPCGGTLRLVPEPLLDTTWVTQWVTQLLDRTKAING